jgi:GLPGLI family protein
MKLFLAFAFFVLVFVETMGQVNTDQSRFSYQKTISVLGTVIDSRTENLFYNGRESVFVTYNKDLSPPADSTITSKGGDRITIEWSGTGDGKDFTLYKNYESGKMALRTVFSNGKICIISDVIPALKWKLEPEKKRIGPYECQKATTTFRCAKYTAWFTNAIPLSIGPAKLGGLPGLIVEATNERANITYKLLTVDYPTATKTYQISAPNTSDPVYSYTEYKKIEIIERDKMKKFMAASAEDPQNPIMVTQEPECLIEP